MGLFGPCLVQATRRLTVMAVCDATCWLLMHIEAQMTHCQSLRYVHGRSHTYPGYIFQRFGETRNSATHNKAQHEKQPSGALSCLGCSFPCTHDSPHLSLTSSEILHPSKQPHHAPPAPQTPPDTHPEAPSHHGPQHWTIHHPPECQ